MKDKLLSVRIGFCWVLEVTKEERSHILLFCIVMTGSLEIQQKKTNIDEQIQRKSKSTKTLVMRQRFCN